MNKSLSSLFLLSVLAIGLSGCYTSPLPRDPIATKYVYVASPRIDPEHIILSDAQYRDVIQTFATSMKNNVVFQNSYSAMRKELGSKLPVVVFNPVGYNFKTDINALNALRDEIKTRFFNMGLFDVKELTSYGGADIQRQIIDYMAKSVDGSLDKKDAMQWFETHRVPEYFFNSAISKKVEPDGSITVILKADLYCLHSKTDRAGLLDWTCVYKLH